MYISGQKKKINSYEEEIISPSFSKKINYNNNHNDDNEYVNNIKQNNFTNIYEKNKHKIRKSKSAQNSLLEEGEEDFWGDCINNTNTSNSNDNEKNEKYYLYI